MNINDILAKTQFPTYEFTMPSTGKTIRYRPWNVREGKILMLADTTGDRIEIYRATKQVVGNCLIDTDISVDELATYDLELLMLQIRAKSVGEVIKVTVKHEDGITKTIPINIEEIKLTRPEGHDPKITILDGVGLKLRDPKVKDVTACLREKVRRPDVDYDLLLVSHCIEQFWQGEHAADTSDIPKADLMDTIGNLAPKQYEGIEKFFDTIPRVRYEIHLADHFPGAEGVHVLEGLQDFFG